GALRGSDDAGETEIRLQGGCHQPDVAQRPALPRRLDDGVELEAGDDGAIEDTPLRQRRHDLRGKAWIRHTVGAAFDLDAECDRGRAEDLDHLLEEEHALSASALEDEPAQLLPALGGDGTLAVRGAVERLVMDDDDPPVGGRMDVELDLLHRQLC